MSLHGGDLLRSRGRWLGGLNTALTPLAGGRPPARSEVVRQSRSARPPDPLLGLRPDGRGLRVLVRAGREVDERLRGQREERELVEV